MRIHLVNPSDNSFGTAVITPRWLFVLAAATPRDVGDPILVDESLEQIDPETIHPGDIVGISVHTGNALRGYQVGRMARSRGAWVVYGGIHATLFPEEALERGAAHAVVKGDGDIVWGKVVKACMNGAPGLRRGRPSPHKISSGTCGRRSRAGKDNDRGHEQRGGTIVRTSAATARALPEGSPWLDCPGGWRHLYR